MLKKILGLTLISLLAIIRLEGMNDKFTMREHELGNSDILIRNQTGVPIEGIFVNKNILTGKLSLAGNEFSLDAAGPYRSTVRELPSLALGSTRQVLISKNKLRFSNDRELIDYKNAADVEKSGGAAVLVGIGRTSGSGSKKTAIAIVNDLGNKMSARDIDFATWVNVIKE